MHADGFENLRAGILQQAMKDYITALTDDDETEAKLLERFFKSDWGELLSGGHGDLIIIECKRRANKH